MCDLSNPEENDEAIPRKRALRLSYDESMTLNQEDQVFGMINSVSKINDSNDIVPSNSFENQLQQSFQKYQINLSKDLIH